MVPKIFYLFFIILANFHTPVDSTAEGVCDAPLWSPGNPAAERIHVNDVSAYSQSFLSGLTTLPVFCAAGNNLIYRLEVEEPCDDDAVMNAARKATGETSPEVVEAAKKQLVHRLKSDSKMRVPLDNDAWLVRFLRLREYNVPATQNLIKDYYTFRAQNPNLYKDLVPSKLSKVAQNNAVSVLPNRDQLGRRILVIRTKNWKPKLYPLMDEWKVGVVLTEAAAYEPATQLAGVQVIIDASGMTLQHVRQFNPFIAKKVIEWVMRSAPFKYGGIHIVKQPRIFWAGFAVFKPLLTPKLKNRIFFHGYDMKSLHDQIPPSYLPTEYGGSLPRTGFSPYEWQVALESFNAEYAKIDSYGMKRRK